MKKKMIFLSSFFLATLTVSFSINNYQSIYQQMVEKTSSNLKLEKRKQNVKNFKSNITANFKKFTEKSSEKMQAYRKAEAAYYLAEEIIAGKEYKNQVLTFLKKMNLENSEFKTIINSYEEELISYIMYLNTNSNDKEEQIISDFIDNKSRKINWIYAKTFEPIDFNNNFIKTIIDKYNLLLREVKEKNLSSKIEDIKKIFSLNLYEKVNKFLIELGQLQRQIRKYLNDVLTNMDKKITFIKSEINKISVNLKSKIPANILKDLHDFESNYFAIKDIFDYLKSEDFTHEFTSLFLEINTKLLALEEFLLSTNKRIIDIIDDNIKDISNSLEQKVEKITVPGVWETIVKDYKAFLKLEKEVEIIAQDTKKMLNFDYNKINNDIKSIKQKFDKIQYQGITQFIKDQNKWKIYFSNKDFQKFKINMNYGSFSIPVFNMGVGYLGTLMFKTWKGVEGASWAKKNAGTIFGTSIFLLTFVFYAIPALLIDTFPTDNNTGIQFEVSELSFIGLTLGAVIELRTTGKEQEKKYLTID